MASSCVKVPRALQSKKFWPAPLSCWIWQVAWPPDPQQAVPAQHFPAQVTSPDGQESPQAPALQISFAGHTVPQTPQFFESVSTFVQTAPHRLGVAEGQRQAPPVQAWADGQAFPQVPQLFRSVEVFAQTCPVPAGQTVRGELHTQAAPLQVNPTLQEFPHPPQFAAFVSRSTQVPVAGSPGGQRVMSLALVDGLQRQPGAPPTAPQVPSPQACPQAPQLFESVEVFAQASPQGVSPAVWHWHEPAWQLAPAMQLLPQRPQFAESVWRSLHSEPHAVSPSGQFTGDEPQLAPPTARAVARATTRPAPRRGRDHRLTSFRLPRAPTYAARPEAAAA